MPNNKFNLKVYEQLIDDVLKPYFQEQNVTHDLEELAAIQVKPELEGVDVTNQDTNI